MLIYSNNIFINKTFDLKEQEYKLNGCSMYIIITSLLLPLLKPLSSFPHLNISKKVNIENFYKTFHKCV